VLLRIIGLGPGVPCLVPLILPLEKPDTGHTRQTRIPVAVGQPLRHLLLAQGSPPVDRIPWMQNRLKKPNRPGTVGQSRFCNHQRLVRQHGL